MKSLIIECIKGKIFIKEKIVDIKEFAINIIYNGKININGKLKFDNPSNRREFLKLLQFGTTYKLAGITKDYDHEVIIENCFSISPDQFEIEEGEDDLKIENLNIEEIIKFYSD